jgi:uncharacterized protein involved in exopolysaccharide biosynthesis
MEVTAQTSGMSNEAADNMRALLYQLQLQEKQLSANFSPDHVKLRQIREQISSAEQILQEESQRRTEVTTGPNREYAEARLLMLQHESELSALQSSYATIQQQLADARNDLSAFVETELKLSRLERERDVQDVSYRKYAENLQQARIDHALQLQRISNISVVQPATRDPRPVTPNLPINVVLGGIFGLFAGCTWAIGRDAVRTRIHSEQDLEQALELPALAGIPRLSRRKLTLNGNL